MASIITAGIGKFWNGLVGGNYKIMKKQNWKKLGIEELQVRYGYDKELANILWEREYRKALRTARKQGVGTDFNISREVYASTFFQGTQLFEVNVDDISPKVQITPEFQGQDIERAFTTARFEHMAQKYEEVNTYLQAYRSGNISYKAFREKVKLFRDTNAEYQKAGS